LALLALLLDCVGVLVIVFAMFLVWEYFPKNDVSRYNLWVGRMIAVAGLAAAVGAALGPWLVVRAKRLAWSPSAVRVAPMVGLASVGAGVLGFFLLGLGTL
jgi:hypothetical protein